MKLLIIGTILAAGGVLAYSQFGASIDRYVPVAAVAQDLDGLKDTTVSRVNYEIDKTADTVGQKIDQITPSADEINPIKKIEEAISVPKETTHYGQVYETDEEQKTCKISVPKLAKTVNGAKELTHTITIKDCQLKKHQAAQVTLIPDTGGSEPQAVSVVPAPQTMVFETLQLKTTKNADNTVSLQYEDTSGKTLKVTVNLRNSEKSLFTGEFFSSKFETNVNDVSSSPHIIEMIVDHADYGTVYSSVYSPNGSDETTINGVFTKS